MHIEIGNYYRGIAYHPVIELFMYCKNSVWYYFCSKWYIE